MRCLSQSSAVRDNGASWYESIGVQVEVGVGVGVGVGERSRDQGQIRSSEYGRRSLG